MNLKTILHKTGGAVKLIMTQPTMLFRNREQVELVEKEYYVKEDEVARPDLIALQYYGNQSKTDIILKWNGISDPFSINDGDELEIPVATLPFYKLERPNNFDDDPVKQQFVDGKRLSKKDQRRLDALKKRYGKDDLLPPNVIPVGKKNYKFDGDNIVMGAQAQNDAVVESINNSLNDSGTEVTNEDVDNTLKIGGENLGNEFKKIPGGVWSWLGSSWLPVNPKVAQQVAGSLSGEHGDPNGKIEGSFEGQLYFDQLPSPGNEDESETSASDAVSTADNVGDNQTDGGNPTPSGGNTNNTSQDDNASGSSPCD